MLNAKSQIIEKVKSLAKDYPRIKDIDIPFKLSDNITLSTMHGCPPDEIEKIGKYLIEEKGYHTAIKLNPTLLGPEVLRGILNDSLGYDVEVPDIAFEHDLKYEDGVELIKFLSKCARDNGVDFGIKLTNTLEVINKRGVLPEDQKMLYMSGRVLHPLSVNIAAKLQKEFKGSLDISFSAGVDCFNLPEVIACGIKPVTMCSDLLKPGGYGRAKQYLDILLSEMEDIGAKDIDEYVLNTGNGGKLFTESALNNLILYSESVVDDPYYSADFKDSESIKTSRKLTKFDCIKAPCTHACAIAQDVPQYMYWTAQGEFEKALDVIRFANPLPGITGMVCDHLCQNKCTRIDYDNSLLIREIKRFNSEVNSDSLINHSLKGIDKKVAIIGAGPSGLSCAYFLALQGYQVEIFEEKGIPGGMVSDAIPRFRLSKEAVNRDVEVIEALGVKIQCGFQIDRKRYEEILDDFDYLYIAVGAKKGKKLGLDGESAKGVWDQLEFLSRVRSGEEIDLGKDVVIVGGGNSAMDAARTAKRLVGSDGSTTVIYRRTRDEMPADKDEIEALLSEGIILKELVAPEELITKNGKMVGLKCCEMELGEPDSSGRPRPVPKENGFFELRPSAIITAIGQDVILDFLNEEDFKYERGSLSTNFENVFIGGDAVRGASTLIKAIADGKKVANIIIAQSEEIIGQITPNKYSIDKKELKARKAFRHFGAPIPELDMDNRDSFKLVHPLMKDEEAIAEASRCLFCDQLCSVCVSVCPNGANVEFEVDPCEYDVPLIIRTEDGSKLKSDSVFKVDQGVQILNLGDFCNECGNCTTFCPTAGAPWRDKIKFYLNHEAFEKEEDVYHFSGNELKWKNSGNIEKLVKRKEAFEYINKDAVSIIALDSFKIEEVKFINSESKSLSLSKAAEMYFLFKSLEGYYLFD